MKCLKVGVIPMSKLDKHGLNYVLDTIRDYLNRFALKAKTVFSVNDITPDSDGNVNVDQVKLADNLTSDKTQESDGEFIIRTSGGNASIEDGDAFILRIMGNRVHNGYVAEELNMTVNPIPRPTPASITATLDDATFEAYVGTAGTYTLTYSNGWSETPATYGVTVSGTPLDGDSIAIVWDGESSPVMTVTAPRVAPDAITATIDRDTFVGYVGSSGTYTFTYTTEWSDDLEDYGITVVGDPVGGDQIVVVYVKEDRGTIVNANPSALTSTGWNLYNHALGYARVAKYSDTYGFRVGGTYTSLAFSETLSGEQETITPVDGMFSVPSDGYVHLLGGNSTDTYIINAWSDWTEGYAEEYEVYSETSVDLSEVMGDYFPYGLLRVENVRDEINLNTLTAISRIGRMAYTAENLASAEASGRPYEVDTDYIYIVKEIEDVNTVIIDGSYVASDHGNEFFDSVVPVYMETLYGNNLKNKLERDVLTISQQTLTSAQQAQVRQNIGSSIANNLTTDTAGYVLDARQGKALSEQIATTSGTITVSSGTTIYSYSLRRSGNTVTLFIEGKFPTTTSTNVFSIPEKFRPTGGQYFPLFNEASNSFVGLIKSTSNGIFVTNNNAALSSHNYAIGYFSWTVND